MASQGNVLSWFTLWELMHPWIAKHGSICLEAKRCAQYFESNTLTRKRSTWFYDLKVDHQSHVCLSLSNTVTKFVSVVSLRLILQIEIPLEITTFVIDVGLTFREKTWLYDTFLLPKKRKVNWEIGVSLLVIWDIALTSDETVMWRWARTQTTTALILIANRK